MTLDIEKAARAAVSPTGNGHVPVPSPALNDDGNALRFAAQHGGDVRFCSVRESWLLWDERRWARDAKAGVMELAKATSRAIYVEAAAAEDPVERKRLAAWAVKSGSEPSLRRMLLLAQSIPGISVTPDQLDTDPYLLNVANGTLDLRTATLRPHRREDLNTRLVPVAFDPDADAPTWRAFLERILNGHAALLGFFQRLMGYALTACTSEQIMVVLWGTGANGKTTLLRIAGDLLGDYASTTPTASLLTGKGDGPRNDIARLVGARLVAAVEAERGRRFDESLVKQLTGGDVVTARFLFGEYFEYTPCFKLILATNSRPEIRGRDHAIWRRIRLVPFTVTIPPEEQDRELPAKLRAELPGILRWAVDGCLAWQHEGLAAPKEVMAATAEYRAEQDTVGQFIADRCVEAENEVSTSAGLWAAYKDWCEQEGEKPLARRAFARALTDRGATVVRTNSWRGLQGIGLATREPEPDLCSGSVTRDTT